MEQIASLGLWSSCILGIFFGVVGFVLFIKAACETKDAPFLVRFFGLNIFCNRYMTNNGIIIRKWSFICWGMFIVFWFIAFACALFINPEVLNEIHQLYEQTIAN